MGVKNEPISIKEQTTEFLLYKSPSGDIKVEVILHNESIWLTQKKIAELFGVTSQNVTTHLKNIFESNELKEDSTCKEILQVRKEGNRRVRRRVKYYNLDAVLSVGYRVSSKKATMFRIWATTVLKEYIIKGFSMDDERLKNGRYFGKDYFNELLERVRSIRASERRIYLQVTDIFQECSIDYDPNSQVTKNFFATVQNKFHFAISGKTAAEIIYDNVDRKQPNMGLQTWKSSPDGRVLQSDVTVAKNYLSEKSIKKLEKTVSSFFDYIENIIENRNTFTMKQFAESVVKFLEFNEYKILEGKGSISAGEAKREAISEYHEFNKTQKIENDFEKQVLKKLKESDT